MRNRILTWLLLHAVVASTAQNVYFNKVYYADTASMGSVAGVIIGNDYLVAGDMNASGNYSAFYIRKLNPTGNEFWNKVIQGGSQYSTMFFGNSMIKFDSAIYMAGVKGQNSTETDIVIMALDLDGNLNETYIYPTPDETEGNTQIVKTTDNGFLLNSWTSAYYASTNTNGPSRFFCLKIDENGNAIWSKKYGYDAVPLYAEQTQDGGFILSGYKYSSATGYDMYAVKTDSLGNLQWQQTYGTDLDDGGCWVKQMENGNYMIIGIINDGNDLKSKLYYAHIDLFGGIIIGSEHLYSKNNYYGIESPFIIYPNNKTIVVTVSFGPPPIWEFAITQFSPEGEILSETPISSGFGGEDYIRDIEPTPDGGYLLVGFNYTSPAKSWVLKVDSLGNSCGIAPCDSIAYPLSTTPARFEPSPQATLYPNPAKGSTTITYSLPPQLPFAVLELYDLQGQKVQYWVLPAGGSSPLNQLPLNPLKGTFTQTIDLSGIAAGVYVWRMAVPGGYERYEASGKLVVE
ncbi:T9SS C-terminal target domain-containing protein [Sphingobacteriales bacterium UPWRP_1]|nr:hypothetical protein B6N25_17170 [Sphingobacteriales bacterium TSM_CSS]PSJ73189.1 T9SS C-terminal target domain-containing protein [Sphingobacteriales bacterium UPWRP_1]